MEILHQEKFWDGHRVAKLVPKDTGEWLAAVELKGRDPGVFKKEKYAIFATKDEAVEFLAKEWAALLVLKNHSNSGPKPI